MASQVSPGVVVNEFDFSDYAERISTAITGMVGWANKGPVDTATLITNERQLVSTFGFPPAPDDASNAFGADELKVTGVVTPAIHFLRQGNQLLVVRVGDGAERKAITNLQAGSQTAVALTALTEGSWPNPDKEVVEFRVSAGTKGGNYFKLEIRAQGIIRETFDNLLADPEDVGDLDNNVATRVNGLSQFIVASDESLGKPDIGTWLATGSGNGVTGLDGETALAANDFTATDRGLNLLADPDTVDINLLAAPGVNDAISDSGNTVVVAMVAIAEARGDALALIDPSSLAATTVANARNYINGEGTWSSAPSINSSYAAYYWPWVKVLDTHSSLNIWSPPSGLVAGVMAFNDRAAESWFAPAGFNRGKVSQGLSVSKNTTLGEHESLYASGEVVNPIVDFPGEGITVWGQKTTQRKSSALNRVNVRRMLNFAKKVIATSVKFLVFEPNDSFTWRRFIHIVNPVLESIKGRRGLTDFKVICDATTNPPDLVDQNQMRGIILMKPTKTAEVITIDFTLLSTGAQFNEFLPQG